MFLFNPLMEVLIYVTEIQILIRLTCNSLKGILMGTFHKPLSPPNHQEVRVKPLSKLWEQILLVFVFVFLHKLTNVAEGT